MSNILTAPVTPKAMKKESLTASRHDIKELKATPSFKEGIFIIKVQFDKERPLTIHRSHVPGRGAVVSVIRLGLRAPVRWPAKGLKETLGHASHRGLGPGQSFKWIPLMAGFCSFADQGGTRFSVVGTKMCLVLRKCPLTKNKVWSEFGVYPAAMLLYVSDSPPGTKARIETANVHRITNKRSKNG